MFNPFVTQYVALVLGGCLVSGAASVWLLFKLGGFRSTPSERRTWLFGAILLVLWSAYLVIAQPRPLVLPFVVAAHLFAVAWLVWSWRADRLAADRLPAHVQPEAIRRQRWFQEHWRLVLGLVVAFLAFNVAWAIIVLFLMRPAAAP